MATCINSAKLVSLLCFMLLLSLVHWNCRKNSDSVITKNIDSLTTIRREKRRQLLQKLDLNYVSKRRVPNGPDPIHNKYVSPFFFLTFIDNDFLNLCTNMTCILKQMEYHIFFITWLIMDDVMFVYYLHSISCSIIYIFCFLIFSVFSPSGEQGNLNCHGRN